MDYLKELFKLDEINSILKQHLSETGNKIDNVNFDSYSVEKLEEGIGYLGQHYNLKIKFKSEKSAENREIYFFVKVATENQQKYLEEIFVFFKETNLYRHVLSAHPGFSQVVPRFYPTSAENVIVLENLMEKGYKLFENDESILDLEHLMAALKALGKFHAASVNFECETGMSLLKKFPEYLVENSYKNDPNGLRKYRLENAIKVFQQCIPEIPLFKDSPGLDEIVQIWPELMRKIYDLCTPSTQYRNVLLHGDLWRNNILFKYGENDSTKPMECKFVDFQFSRYGPAALDVMTLIILTTYRDFREEHMENLLNFYYANFLAHITHKNIPIESFDVFRESCEYFTLAGLIEKSLFTHYPPELPKDLTSHIQIDYSGDNYIRNFPFELARIAYHSDDNYRKRLDDVVFEVVEKFIEFD